MNLGVRSIGRWLCGLGVLLLTGCGRGEIESSQIMDSGADPDLANREGATPLMLAVSARQFALATEMLNRSKVPAAVDRNGMNLVHLAFYVALSRQVSFNLTPEVRAFIILATSKGVDPLAPIGSSGTLKDLAEQAGAIDVARFLVELKR